MWREYLVSRFLKEHATAEVVPPTLTKKQQAVLDWMIENQRVIFPTVREIAAHFDVYPSTIHGHIECLRSKGFLPVSPKEPATAGEAVLEP
jgi:hypothetical protein